MKREYQIKNLHCGGCASKIQFELDKVKDIKEVNVDFYTKKLKFTLASDDIDEKELFIQLNKIADRVEPGTVFVYEEKEEESHEHPHEHDHGNMFSSKIQIVLLSVGITLFIVGLTLGKSLQKDIILTVEIGRAHV